MKKALLYLFGFVLIQFFVSWAVYAATAAPTCGARSAAAIPLP